MTERELVLEETRRILARMPKKKKRASPPEPSPRALREDVLIEGDDDVLTKARNLALGVPPRPSLETAKLMEAIRLREVGGRSATVPGDLHERLRKAVSIR